MKSRKELITLIPTALGLAALILDGSTAIEGARAGLEVCLRTVLPSLFPFIFLSSILTTSLLSLNFKGSSFICKLVRIPYGAEGILLTGLLGGYPVGAKCIGDAVSEKRLKSSDAERMLVFCNAAGPAFLFGITSSVFSEGWIPWILWGIHLLSSFCIAKLLPSTSSCAITKTSPSTRSISHRLRDSVHTMAEICGWIILMRTIIAILQKWCIWCLPKSAQILITGILELSNGCISLMSIENTGLRFMLCSIFLGFGGLCVALQTSSAAPIVSQRMYLPGKCIQALISFIISYTVQYFIFDNKQKLHFHWDFFVAIVIVSGITIYSICKTKKRCGNLENIGV